jgi:hypothetical protein
MLCHAGAKVKVSYASASTLGGKAAGDVAAVSETNSDGSFAVGPLPSDATYSLEVAKAGHVLQQEGEGFVFSSKQLAQVTHEGGVRGGCLPMCLYF